MQIIRRGSGGDKSVIRRAFSGDKPSANAKALKYELLSLEDIDLGYPGRFTQYDRIYTALSALQPGDKLIVRPSTRGIKLSDDSGRAVARLSLKAGEIWKNRLSAIREVRVLAISGPITELLAAGRGRLRSKRRNGIMAELKTRFCRGEGNLKVRKLKFGNCGRIIRCEKFPPALLPPTRFTWRSFAWPITW
jgi:hypothetical protein